VDVATDVLGFVFGFTSPGCGCGNRRAEFYVSGSRIRVYSRSLLKKSGAIEGQRRTFEFTSKASQQDRRFSFRDSYFNLYETLP